MKGVAIRHMAPGRLGGVGSRPVRSGMIEDSATILVSCGCFDILGLALGYFPPPVGLINLIFFFPISHRTTNTYLWSAAWEGGQPQRFYQKPFQYCCIHSPFKLHSSTTSIGGESSE